MEGNLILRARLKTGLSAPKEHYHNAYQILYIKSGRGRIAVNGTFFPVEKGTVIFMSPLRLHYFEMDGGACERYEVLINYSRAETLLNNQELMSVFQARPDVESCIVDTAKDFSVICAYFNDIIKESANEDEFTDEIQAGNVYRLLGFIFRNYGDKMDVSQSQPEKHINRIRKFIEEKFSEPVTVEEIADKFHLNRYYLTHSFKKVTGYSPKQYILLCRIAKARQLLSGSENSIMSIATSCGFADASNFTRQFKNETGYTPKEFRLKHKNVI